MFIRPCFTPVTYATPNHIQTRHIVSISMRPNVSVRDLLLLAAASNGITASRILWSIDEHSSGVVAQAEAEQRSPVRHAEHDGAVMLGGDS